LIDIEDRVELLSFAEMADNKKDPAAAVPLVKRWDKILREFRGENSGQDQLFSTDSFSTSNVTLP
jgi:hypothetical protein